MPLSKIVVLFASTIAVALAIIAFIRTPKAQRYTLPKHVKDEGVEYAPEFEPAERKTIAIKTLSWAIPLFIAAKFWFLPWFEDYIEQAHCYNYGTFTGWHFVSYFMFIAPFLTFAAILLVGLVPRFIKVIQFSQFPPPNEKVFSPTKYIYGWRAKLRAYLGFAFLLFTIGCSIWGYFAANEFMQSLGSNWPECINS